MFDYIKGIVTENTPTYVVVETTGGVGYMLNVSLNTFESLQNCKGEVKLLVHEVIREDAWTLFGFMTSHERELFRLLIGVSGVGPNTASLILSAIAPADLEAVIVSGDHARLKNVKGIGTKTAQRVIVDLRDKIKPSGDTLFIQTESTSEVFEEALAALVMLGFPRPAAQKVLKKIFDADPAAKVEAAIKKALAML